MQPGTQYFRMNNSRKDVIKIRFRRLNIKRRCNIPVSKMKTKTSLARHEEEVSLFIMFHKYMKDLIKI